MAKNSQEDGGGGTGRRKRKKGKAIEEWGKTWGRVMELPGGAVGALARFSSDNLSKVKFWIESVSR
jgi:hypothetical protein